MKRTFIQGSQSLLILIIALVEKPRIQKLDLSNETPITIRVSKWKLKEESKKLLGLPKSFGF